ncbi:MAG TPA: EF-hand domain-containing protein [Rhodanobacteraceae bacterium]|nr:EF-hand domain-containing protein [Rhodanobacteraceae bacterium]
MNTRQTTLTLLIAAAMSFATVSFAQETPPTSDQAAQENQEMQQQQQTEPLGMQSSGAEDWSMLKGHEKGYVEKGDALPNSWLESNFAMCDKDGDGKVTEAEYTKCLKARP